MNDYEKKHQDAMARLQKQHDGYVKRKEGLQQRLKDLDDLIEASENQMKSLEKVYAAIKKKMEEIDAKWCEYDEVLPKRKKKENVVEEKIFDSLPESEGGNVMYGN